VFDIKRDDASRNLNKIVPPIKLHFDDPNLPDRTNAIKNSAITIIISETFKVFVKLSSCSIDV